MEKKQNTTWSKSKRKSKRKSNSKSKSEKPIVSYWGSLYFSAISFVAEHAKRTHVEKHRMLVF